VSSRVARIALAGAAIALSVMPFLQLVQLGVDVVKVYAGFAAFAGLASLVPLAICEITFVIAVGALLDRARRRGRLVPRFLGLAGLELLALPAVELLRYVVFLPATGGDLAIHRSLLRPGYLSLAAAGAALGLPAVAASLVTGRRAAR
jgi:hypothetical protein